MSVVVLFCPELVAHLDCFCCWSSKTVHSGSPVSLSIQISSSSPDDNDTNLLSWVCRETFWCNINPGRDDFPWWDMRIRFIMASRPLRLSRSRFSSDMGADCGLIYELREGVCELLLAKQESEPEPADIISMEVSCPPSRWLIPFPLFHKVRCRYSATVRSSGVRLRTHDPWSSMVILWEESIKIRVVSVRILFETHSADVTHLARTSILPFGRLFTSNIPWATSCDTLLHKTTMMRWWCFVGASLLLSSLICQRQHQQHAKSWCLWGDYHNYYSA